MYRINKKNCGYNLIQDSLSIIRVRDLTLDLATSDPIIAVESILLMYDIIRTSEYWDHPVDQGYDCISIFLRT